MKISTCAFFAALPLICLCTARADDLQGADAILKAIAAHNEAEAAHPANAGETPDKLRADLNAFRKTAADLAPGDAASQWLALADRYAKLLHTVNQPNPSMYQTMMQFNFTEVVAAVPPPAAWPALAKAVDARPAGEGLHEIVLRLIAHRLVNDNAALNKDIDAMQALLEKVGGPVDSAAQFADALRAKLQEDTDNGAAIVKGLDVALSQPVPADYQGPLEIQVPDLVSLVGPDKAASFLRKALNSVYVIGSISGDDTEKLARKLALEMVVSLKKPQWVLADSIDSTALFEAMQKRFPNATKGNDAANYARARMYYVLGLIASHRAKEAAAIALRIGPGEEVPYTAVDALERAGLTAELADFFHDLLSQNPGLPYWSEYLDVAVRAGEQKKMLALIEAAAARPGLTQAQRLPLDGYLWHAYLATDQVDEGIAILRKQIEEVSKAMDPALQEGHASDDNFDVGALGTDLAQIGGVLGRKDLVDEGIRVATDAVHKLEAQPGMGPNNFASKAEQLAVKLVELDRAPQAEALLKEALLSVPRGQYSYRNAQSCLVALMGIYDRANRPADVLALLDGAPCWGSGNLRGALTGEVVVDRNPDYAGYYAANALAATGHNADAVRILNALLDAEPGYDPAYELLIKIAPRDEVLARFDALFARDKYEPRPLIWKAKVLLDAGKLEEAEAIARQAVTIDPSDGEHGPGRRMRVYAVLADILQARGDKAGADNYRGAVTAIRHSEDADRFYEAGLITRAVKMYDEALTHFADAYCIQSRLALRMAELGDMEGAEKHYRRAYELMPDSFGRVESHCFGCERAFDGYYAQHIAEQVFTNLAKTRPDKPQVHYLLAYLRKEQDNFRGALPELREAVKLDPEYLNAWKMIDEISRYVRLPAAERDAVQLNLVRLDPLGRHSDPELGNIVDLAAAWNALDAASKLWPPDPGPLYPLKASADEMARLKAVLPPQAGPGFAPAGEEDSGAASGQDQRRDPGSVVSQNEFIQTVCELFSYDQMPAQQWQ